VALSRWTHLFKPLITQGQSFCWKRNLELEMSSISVEHEPRVYVVRMRQLVTLIGLSRSTIYVLVSKGRFPGPIRLGDKAVGWRVNEIEEWLNARPNSIDLYRRGK
jgi:prophage regulatory protein